ncbi:MAG: NUDIX hydrolase [Sporocytophaga sp.]|uniref:NUDIX domain-containing protein n=1 Tax=Sporocytophaga sp. TaxID=2231183 RepID=UPI001B20F95F|nr:NUDIX hydrolase [Sporocytophaga sp.]MBO9700851.1 NUDIX hydrolase [Sporocytophaga sp.]
MEDIDIKELQQDIIDIYGNKTRVKVRGLLFRNHSDVLLIKHLTIGKNKFYYAPPGGGIDFGESAEESLIREFYEETGLRVKIKNFLFTHEYLIPPFHEVELFFEIEETGGKLKIGEDPEMESDNQIIEEVKFWNLGDIQKKDASLFHNIFRLGKTETELLNLKGYFLQKGII